MSLPEVRYVRSGDVHIAYQVLGDGPDLVLSPGGWNHLLLRWELPANARLLRRLASFSRLILWDKRGTGLSDRHGHIPHLSAQLEDLAAVLDAVGSARAAHVGIADGAVVSILHAAAHPERTPAVVLYGALRRFNPGDDGLGISREFLVAVEAGGDPARLLELIAPSVASDPAVREWWTRYATSSVSPGTAVELARIWSEVELAPILPSLRVPTTVIQRLDDRVVPPPNGRSVAELVPDARYVELPGDFGTFGGDIDALADAIEEAVTGGRRAADPDRVLATILFTDIVDSTVAAAAAGDSAWRALLDDHDQLLARQVAHGGGRLIKTLGDGALATFDSPARAIECAAEVVAGLDARGVHIRAGVHTGECERRGDDVSGIAVHIASRVAGLAGAGEILVTGTVRDLVVGTGLTFSDRGERELRGVPGRWRVLAVEPAVGRASA